MKPASEENLTARESLDIISAMIREAKGKLQRNNFFFLFWGWVVVIANLGMYLLGMLDYEHPYAVWVITVPAWIYTLYKVFSRKKVDTTATHFDKISGAVWLSFGVTIFCFVGFGHKINFQLNPAILLISAIPTIVSGVILNFRPLVVGGIIFWIGGMINFLMPMETQPLVGAVAIMGGYLIPGYMLKKRKE